MVCGCRRITLTPRPSSSRAHTQSFLPSFLLFVSCISAVRLPRLLHPYACRPTSSPSSASSSAPVVPSPSSVRASHGTLSTAPSAVLLCSYSRFPRHDGENLRICAASLRGALGLPVASRWDAVARGVHWRRRCSRRCFHSPRLLSVHRAFRCWCCRRGPSVSLVFVARSFFASCCGAGVLVAGAAVHGVHPRCSRRCF